MRLVVSAAVLAVSACQAAPSEKPPPEGSFGPVLFEDPIDVAWGESAIFVVREGDGDFERTVLIELDPDTGREEQVALEGDGCLSIAPLSPEAIDDHLRIVFGCDSPGERTISLVEYDLESGNRRELIHDIGFPPHSYGTPDGGETWFAADSSGICAWISRLTGNSGPWPITITDGQRPFAVDEGLEGVCDNLGMAGEVEVADDGSLAFVASPDALGVGGGARSDVRWNVYTIGPTDTEPTKLASGFTRPTDLGWADSMGSIEVAATRGGRSALWEVDRSGAVSAVVDANVIDFAREPGGSRIAVIVLVGDPVDGRAQLILWNPTQPARVDE